MTLILMTLFTCLLNYICFCKFVFWVQLSSSEAATETIFENICSFHPGAPFFGFFQEASCVHQTNTYFPGRYVSLPPIFQEAFFYLSLFLNYSSKGTCIFMKRKQPPRPLDRQTDRKFPGRYSPSNTNRYFSIRSRWLAFAS